MWCVLDPNKTYPPGKKTPRLLCLCKCGAQKLVRVERGIICGTMCSDCKSKHHKTLFFLSKTNTYGCWGHIKDRCTNSRYKEYEYYGGRGVTISEDWKVFANFYRDMGERPPGMQLDRIDNNSGYCKENCRWATPTQNNRNKRNNRRVMFGGVNMLLMDVCKIIGLKLTTVYTDMRRNAHTPEESIIHLIGKGLSPIAHLNG